MNINQKAIQLLEEHQYEESLKRLQEAVERSRDVQWIIRFVDIHTLSPSRLQIRRYKRVFFCEKREKSRDGSFFG
ncbi:hypothetical protein [Desmospora activa]|uniref:Uncharacterized protein n=1 Tax=Desmospora activa DSM 45169 TaxID=1121389 RepID=A0A2T4Z3N4_9BACL|nr:hypothetical protein [Desmospora activa]PTM56503.1 hypothetical protein C8J48_2825 [Desmospora activa DSM 45169]